MPLSKADATAVVTAAFPGSEIREPIDYNGLFVFIVTIPDPEEGGWDPFVSVNQETGELRDFSVITDGDINEIAALFKAQEL